MDSTLTSIFQLIVLLFSVVVHEVAHGAMAESLGDDTARHMGRMTLNPLKHLDLFGSVLLPFLLLLIRSPFIFGYAKPVPYNPSNLRDKQYGPAKVALAGPATNIVLAVLAAVTVRIMIVLGVSQLAIQLVAYVVVVNLILALFNLIPIPPLDGHWLLMTFLPVRFMALRQFLYRNSLLLLVVIILFILPLLFPVVGLAFKFLTGLSAV